MRGSVRLLVGLQVAIVLAVVTTAATAATTVASRKVHGSAGPFDLPIVVGPAIGGSVSVEPRAAVGGVHTLVFDFGVAINNPGTATVQDVTSASLGTATPLVSNNMVVVTLTGVPDNVRALISLSNVNGSLSASVAMGFLVGDVDNSRSVTPTDVSAVKARAGQFVDNSNFKYDLGASGVVSAADVVLVKNRSGAVLRSSSPPTVTLANVTGVKVGVVTTLNASASVNGGTIAKVEFFQGATKLGEDTVAPFSFDWTPVAEGLTVLLAKATDNVGSTAYSLPVNVLVGPIASSDAARLLAQSTFGATLAEINRVAAMTPSAYLDEQINAPQTMHLTTVRNDPNYPTAPYAVMTPSIWKQYFEANDQLRQRAAFALSQIMVISMQNNTIGDQACGSAYYLDTLGRNAFGNFRTLLKEVTLSPAMGEYLDMKGSAKADPTLNSIPSENFARELMQLFSIGTVMLNIDGSVQFSNGKPINTYSEATAQEFARALTGWNFAGQDQTKSWRWLYPDVPYPSDAASAATACTAWSTPLEPWLAMYRSSDDTRDILGGAHDTGAKTLLTYPGSAGFSQNVPASQTPMQDIDAVVDNIFNHPNVGPFIGEQLIQRLVTSNPSGAYVTRVASIFNNNGQGVRGDMKAVVRAILLDPEARAPLGTQLSSFGKLREPVIRFTHLHRAFGAVMSGGYYASIYDLGASDSLGQSPLRAPSVFNFYHPDYAPSGPLSQASLFGPEFEITNSATISGFMDFSKNGILGGFGQSDADPAKWLKPNYDAYVAMAGNPAQMVDALNTLLLAGSMSQQFRTQLIDVATKLTDSVPATQNTERFKTVLWLIMNSPEYSIQK